MHYYRFHIGDYRKATDYLSNEEDITYRRLLDMYYDKERPIPTETQTVSKRLRVGKELVDYVLAEFFQKTEKGWVHNRCEVEIEKYNQKCARNRESGKLGGRPKKTQTVSRRFPDETQMKPRRNPDVTLTKNQEPITNNQEKELPPYGGCPQKADAETQEQEKVTTCPHKEIVAEYHRVLPELSQVKVWTKARQAMLQSRWREDKERQSIAWWTNYFTSVRKCPLLMGNVPGKNGGIPFRADLEWLIRPQNMPKVLEGRYQAAVTEWR